MKTPKIILSAGAITAFSLGLAFGQTGQSGASSGTATGQTQQQPSEAQSQINRMNRTEQPVQRTPAEIGLGQPGRVFQESPEGEQPVEALTRQERERQEAFRREALQEGDPEVNPHLQEVERQVERTRERLARQRSQQESSASGRDSQSGGAVGEQPVVGVPGQSDPQSSATEFGRAQSRSTNELDQEMLEETGPIFPSEDDDLDALGNQRTTGTTGARTTDPTEGNQRSRLDRSRSDDSLTQPSLSGETPRTRSMRESVPDRGTQNTQRRSVEPQSDRLPQVPRAADRQGIDPVQEGSTREFGGREGRSQGTGTGMQDSSSDVNTRSNSGTSGAGTSSSSGTSGSSGSSSSGGGSGGSSGGGSGGS